jgi:threonine synthase
MKFVSTRREAAPASLSEALVNGAAPDGGLYLPEALPKAPLGKLDPKLALAPFAAALLGVFFAGDPLEGELSQICAEAFDFPVPIAAVDHRRPSLRVLELFHGPTGAFKDFGARFLMGCLDRLQAKGPLTVLAATSGDTGGAVGCAAERRSQVRGVILYPAGRVSPFQERQLTCWGDNVLAVEVQGDFDDCQRLVKLAFQDPALVRQHRLTSANSINIGRLLPQLAYAAWAAIQVHSETGEKPGFIVPSGNLGHGFAVLLARAMGVPIEPVVLATNANPTLKEWHESGRFEPRASVPTLANAMDVGNPSNFERLQMLPAEARDIRVELVGDEQIRNRISSEFALTHRAWCPHSATALEAWSRLADLHARPWIAAATAHPYKFAEVVEPLIGEKLRPSAELASIAVRRSRKAIIPPTIDALAQALGPGVAGRLRSPSTGASPGLRGVTAFGLH